MAYEFFSLCLNQTFTVAPLSGLTAKCQRPKFVPAYKSLLLYPSLYCGSSKGFMPGASFDRGK